ncbi:hypothetical protein FKM82_019043, partial [Ascaphus truei]
CDSSDQFWYTGHRCQIAVSKPGVYGGVGAGLAVFLIIIVALAVISCRRRRGPVRERLIDSDQRWYEDGWEADNQGGSSVSSGNTQGSQGSRSGNFQPTLDKVNPDVEMTTARPRKVPLRF